MTQGIDFGGRYAVIDSAGVGGMAEVYRARDELLGREVAVKVLNERFAQDKAFVERFRREAQAVANLNHPNIVSLFDFGSNDSTYFIVMEYIDGRSLEDVIADSPLMPERAAEIAADVAWALQRAHDAGLIHRDVKPSNIMLATTGQTKVTDFGIVRALSRDSEQTMTQAGMVIGTAAYLSPEQAQGKELDARSDLYSLGVVLYEMLTGQTPFQGETPLAVAYKHVRENAVRPSSINPDVPGELDSIVMKAMAKNPDNRFSNASEMRSDLLRFLSGEPVEATPVLAGDTPPGGSTVVAAPVRPGTEVMERTEVAPRRERSRTGWFVLAALVMTALIAGLAFLLADNLFDNEPQPPGAPARVLLPDLVGQDVNRARDTLQELRLQARVVSTSSKKPLNQVVRQNPESGERVERGSEVVLTVSLGPAQTEVPKLEGLPLEEARTALEDAGLGLGNSTEQASEEVQAGRVINQSIAPETTVDEGTSVDVIVSSGAEGVPVPFVEGQSEDTAVDDIEAVGLVARVSKETNPDVEEGLVVSQNPAGGAEVESGSEVAIVVSKGPEEPPDDEGSPGEQALEDLTGLSADEAETVLEGAGYEVDQEKFTGKCKEPPGAVCDQSPDPGVPLESGETVTLFVKGGAPD